MDVTTFPTGDPTLHMNSATIAAVALHRMPGTCPAQHVNPNSKLALWHHTQCLLIGDLSDVRILPVYLLHAEVLGQQYRLLDLAQAPRGTINELFAHRGGRGSFNEQRRMDMETFGGTGVARPFAGRGRRGGPVSMTLLLGVGCQTQDCLLGCMVVHAVAAPAEAAITARGPGMWTLIKGLRGHRPCKSSAKPCRGSCACAARVQGRGVTDIAAAPCAVLLPGCARMCDILRC